MASQFAFEPARSARLALPLVAGLAAIVAASTVAFAATHRFEAPATQAPAAALDVLKQRNAKRILNDLPFAGYFISKGIPVLSTGAPSSMAKRS